MEINQIHNEHEHASVSTKVLLLAFAVVLVGVLGYLVYDQRTAPDTTDYSAPSVKKNTEQAAETPTDKTTTTTDETANWKTYSNTTLGISFRYPPTWYVREVSADKRIYIENNKDGAAFSKDNPIAGFEIVWLSYNNNDYAFYEATVADTTLTTLVKKVIESDDGLTINFYTYGVENSSTVNQAVALWQKSTDTKYSASIGTELGVTRQNDEIKVLEGLLSTFKFIN